MEKDVKFLKEVAATVKKALTSYHIPSKAIQEDTEQLKKMEDDLSSSYDNFTSEMLEDIESLKKVLQSAGQGGNHSEAYCLLESLQACFHPPSQQWIDVTIKAKRRLLNEAQQVIIILKNITFLHKHILKSFIACNRFQMITWQ